ncbi:hypothetical protein [Kibdelosporangium philippinense]
MDVLFLRERESQHPWPRPPAQRAARDLDVAQSVVNAALTGFERIKIA